MAGEITIANHAARLLKVQRITSLDQPDNQFVRALNDVMAPVRRRLLRKHNWNFAIERFSVSPDLTGPTYGFKYSYTLPPKTLKLIELEFGANNPYKLEGNKKLLTDYGPSLRGRVVVDVTDASTYDAHFASLYAHDLALETAEDMGCSATRKAEIAQRRAEILSDAIQDDSFEDTPDNYLDEEDQDVFGSRW